jgi:ABC-2 type transport system permease protein
MSRGGSFREVTLAVAWRSLHNFFTNPSLLIPALLFPLFFFTAFAGGLSSVADVPAFDFPAGYTAFQFVFVLLQASAFGGVFTGFSIASDFERGFARRLLLAAPNRLGILAGYGVAALVRAIIVGGLLFAVALATGMQITGGGVELFGLIVLAALVNVTALLFAAGVAFRTRTIQAGPAMQMPVFIVLFLAPVFVPLQLVGGWVHAVAKVNPITALLEGGRDLISGQDFPVGLAYGVAVGLVLLFSIWAVRGLRRAEAAG